MALSIKDETLQLALREAGVKTLPKSITPSDNMVWISAIALTKRINAQESYVCVVNDGEGNPIIKRDFGPYIAIADIISIHPIEMLNKRFIPDLRSDKQMIGFLEKNGYNPTIIANMLDKNSHATPEAAKTDRARVKSFIHKAAIEIAKKALSEDKRIDKMKDYASRIKSNEK